MISLLLPLLLQQVAPPSPPGASPAEQNEIENALRADQAATAPQSAPPGTAPATSAPAGTRAPAVPATQGQPGASTLPQPDSGWSSQTSVRRPGAGLLNPDVSVILDADFGYYGVGGHDNFVSAGLPLSGDDPGREGFGMQEVELALQEAIDPYLEGALFLTIPNLDGIEVEEGYLVTTSLPWNLQLKAGSFRSKLSRNGSMHLHMQQFTRRPLMTPLLFGADGLRGPGMEVSALLPVPWFTTVYLEAYGIDTPEDTTYTTSFGGGGRRTPANLTYAAVIEQYWDVTESASLLLDLGAATGKACLAATMAGGVGCSASPRSYLYGGSLYLKWKPANVVKTYASVQWTTEWWLRGLVADGALAGVTEGAGYSEPVLQFARRWYAGVRFDMTGGPSGPNVLRRYGVAGSLTFAASEFSRVRAYVQEIMGPDIASSTVAFLQAEISMGAHGAHPF